MCLRCLTYFTWVKESGSGKDWAWLCKGPWIKQGCRMWKLEQGKRAVYIFIFLKSCHKLNRVFSYSLASSRTKGALDSWVVKFKIRQASVWRHLEERRTRVSRNKQRIELSIPRIPQKPGQPAQKSFFYMYVRRSQKKDLKRLSGGRPLNFRRYSQGEPLLWIQSPLPYQETLCRHSPSCSR